MAKRQIALLLALQIIFVVIFFSFGCSTLKKPVLETSVLKSKSEQGFSPELKRLLTDDVMVFVDLWQVDMDNDGQKDILALYNTDFYGRGVKVIKIDNGAGSVIFKCFFAPRDIKIEMKKGIPLIVVNEENVLPWMSSRKVFVWNGEAFVSTKNL